MFLSDVNVLVYAFRSDMPGSDDYANWLNRLLVSSEQFGMSELVLGSFLRIVTNPKIYARPSTIDNAIAFIVTVHRGLSRFSRRKR
ncbi:MAG: hypothetical protein IT426_04805 [Pirellulales bacterium]|nr:hypothetical protein [Pirellulales bacterium]